jgi:hypothetical protein
MIRTINASAEGLEIKYHRGRDDERVFRIYLDRFDRNILQDKIKLISVPESGEGDYYAEVDPRVGEYVRSRLAAASGTSRWSREKGDIAEEILCYLLSMSTLWEDIARHPYGKGWKLYESNNRGPDTLHRFKVSGELCYFEFKWWEKFRRKACMDARKQALAYLLKHPYLGKRRVTGAYIGILDWDTRRSMINLHVEKT